MKKFKHSGRSTRVSKKTVERLLGAKKVPGKAKVKGGPLTVMALREFVAQRLCSKGGRPALDGIEDKRRKVSLLKSDARLLEKLCERLSKGDIKVNKSQLIASLVHFALERLEDKDVV